MIRLLLALTVAATAAALTFSVALGAATGASTTKFMLFSKRVHLVLEIAEGEETVRFRDRCGKSFTRYEGHWHLTPTELGTELTYTLTAQPAFDVPGFLLKRLLERDSKDMIDQLRREIARRGEGPP